MHYHLFGFANSNDEDHAAELRGLDFDVLVKVSSAKIVPTHVDGSANTTLSTGTFESKLDRPPSRCFDLFSGLFWC